MKKIAKQRLKGVYFYSVIVWLVYMFVTDQSGTYKIEFKEFNLYSPTISDLIPDTMVWGTILWLFFVFVVLPLTAATEWFFLRIADGQKARWREILEVFTKRNYIRYFLASSVISIFIFLWTMLLVVPGIIKAFSYSQTIRLMRDNPDLGVMEAINLSRERMNGRKTELFFLQLSFVVWFIIPVGLMVTAVVIHNTMLAAVADIIIFITLMLIGPYFQTTNAVFYVEEIREQPEPLKL